MQGPGAQRPSSSSVFLGLGFVILTVKIEFLEIGVFEILGNCSENDETQTQKDKQQQLSELLKRILGFKSDLFLSPYIVTSCLSTHPLQGETSNNHQAHIFGEVIPPRCLLSDYEGFGSSHIAENHCRCSLQIKLFDRNGRCSKIYRKG